MWLHIQRHSLRGGPSALRFRMRRLAVLTSHDLLMTQLRSQQVRIRVTVILDIFSGSTDDSTAKKMHYMVNNILHDKK